MFSINFITIIDQDFFSSDSVLLHYPVRKTRSRRAEREDAGGEHGSTTHAIKVTHPAFQAISRVSGHWTIAESATWIADARPHVCSCYSHQSTAEIDPEDHRQKPSTAPRGPSWTARLGRANMSCYARMKLNSGARVVKMIDLGCLLIPEMS